MVVTPTEGALNECIVLLKKHNIKVVVFDMDLTAVAQHSQGRLQRGDQLKEYLSHVTLAFQALVPRLHKEQFGLAMATHSDQAEFGGEIQSETHILGDELARAVLEHCFTSTTTAADEKDVDTSIVSSFFIVAYNPRVHPPTNNDEDNQIKRYHMRQVKQRFGVIDGNEIVFFDDTVDVVKDCVDVCGVRAIAVDPQFGFRLEDLLENLR
jgi:hypothetical protein